MRKIIFKIESGQSLVEVVVAVSIFLIIAATSAVVIVGTLSSSRRAEEETIALSYTSQGLEAARSIADISWAGLTDGEHGVIKSGDIWVFSGNSDTNGKFTRKVVVSPVYRDASGNIISAGGSLDNSTKKVTSRVVWNFISSKLVAVEDFTYLTDWQRIVYSPVSQSETPTPTVTLSPTLSPTAVVTATPTLTPTPTTPPSCSSLCLSSNPNYISGTCRKTSCKNGEVKLSVPAGICSAQFVCCCK